MAALAVSSVRSEIWVRRHSRPRYVIHSHYTSHCRPPHSLAGFNFNSNLSSIASSNPVSANHSALPFSSGRFSKFPTTPSASSRDTLTQEPPTSSSTAPTYPFTSNSTELLRPSRSSSFASPPTRRPLRRKRRRDPYPPQLRTNPRLPLHQHLPSSSTLASPTSPQLTSPSFLRPPLPSRLLFSHNRCSPRPQLVLPNFAVLSP